MKQTSGNPYYETFHQINELGVQLAYHTTPGGYHPLHWHEEIELLYQLNGEADVQIEGRKYHIANKHLVVIDSRQVHSTYTHRDTSMFLCVHISRKYMEKYLPDINLYQIRCLPDDIEDEKFPEYLILCKQMEQLTRLYIENAPAFQMEAEGIIMQALALLIRHFSTRSTTGNIHAGDRQTLTRIREVITYVDENFRNPISLQDIADHMGLGKEYFCRFFKKNMEMSFLQYVNEVRVSHIYQDLIRTDTPISELAEENGFTNQKLFNRTFKKIYGCTPSAVRRKN